MKRVLGLYLFLCAALIVAWPCYAQVSQTGAGLGAPVAPTGYQGVGDKASGWNAWYSCVRAYNAAFATGSNASCNLSRASDSHTCDVLIATSGTWGITANCTPSGDNGTAVATWCAATTCSVVEMYDQTGNGNHQLQSTAANQFTVAPAGSCFATATFGQCLASANQFYSSSSGLTFGFPYSFTIVAEIVTGSGTFQTGIGMDANAGVLYVTCSSLNTSNMMYAGSIVCEPPSPAAAGTMKAVQGVASASNTCQLNENGVDITGIACGTNTPTAQKIVIFQFGGSGQVSDGYFSEGGMIESALTLTQRTNICKNQQAYYGAGNFPASC
jgi:hypothetical protein